MDRTEGESVQQWEVPLAAHEEQYSEDGVDITLIRWMLSITPAERLHTLQGIVRSMARLRGDGPIA